MVKSGRHASPATSSNRKPLVHPNHHTLRNPQRKISPLELSSQSLRWLSDLENARLVLKESANRRVRKSPKLSDLLRRVVLFECAHISIIFAPPRMIGMYLIAICVPRQSLTPKVFGNRIKLDRGI
jgi:hypothetical protein